MFKFTIKSTHTKNVHHSLLEPSLHVSLGYKTEIHCSDFEGRGNSSYFMLVAAATAAAPCSNHGIHNVNLLQMIHWKADTAMDPETFPSSLPKFLSVGPEAGTERFIQWVRPVRKPTFFGRLNEELSTLPWLYKQALPLISPMTMPNVSQLPRLYLWVFKSILERVCVAHIPV